jgi:hypothetical protein
MWLAPFSSAGELWDSLRVGDTFVALAGLNVLAEISHYDHMV